MTYEEWLIERAKRQCNRLYTAELICASAALLIIFFYLFARKYELLLAAALIFALCALVELAILVIEKKTKKHIERRLRALNKSLKIRLRRIPQDKVKTLKRDFQKEYGFLEGK